MPADFSFKPEDEVNLATLEYERAKVKVSEALLEFLQAADAIGRNGQVAMAEVLGTFMAAAEQAQETASV